MIWNQPELGVPNQMSLTAYGWLLFVMPVASLGLYLIRLTSGQATSPNKLSGLQPERAAIHGALRPRPSTSPPFAGEKELTPG